MTVHGDNTVAVDLAHPSARCAGCGLDERPTYWLGKRTRCASCVVRAICPERLTVVRFGAVAVAR